MVSSLTKEVYDPKTFIPHAASLRQAFAHCAIFPIAATRRCRARISVPLWLTDLSVQLPVTALVSHYLTNKLMGRRLFFKRPVTVFTRHKDETMRYYLRFRGDIPHLKVDSYAFLTRLPL